MEANICSASPNIGDPELALHEQMMKCVLQRTTKTSHAAVTGDSDLRVGVGR